MGDPGITVEDVVVHSVRHTSAGVKLRLSKGRSGRWRLEYPGYAHILDEDRRSLPAENPPALNANAAFISKSDRSAKKEEHRKP